MADLSLTACLGYAHAKLACEHRLDKLDAHLKASGSSCLDSVVVRIGQLSGPECTGEWATAEHVAMIVQSSNTIRALPRLTGEASWIPVDRAAKAMVELANVSHGSRESTNATSTPSRTFDILHLENGARRSWADILKIFARNMDLSSTDTLEWEAWLASVQKLGNQIDDSVPQTPVDANPCIKILDFLQQDFLRLGTGGVVLDLAKARSYSRTLRNSQAISDELIQLYLDGWKGQGWLRSPMRRTSA